MRSANLPARYLIVSLLLVVSVAAQGEHWTGLGRSMPCPHPAKLVLNGHSPVKVVPKEFPPAIAMEVATSVFNQPQNNKSFGYTFSFPVCPKECCSWTTGYLTATFKALQSSSANDIAAIYVNGVAVVSSQSIWGGTIPTNAIKTSTFAISGSALAHGKVSLFVKNDTAVVSAQLALEGCCLCSK